MKNTILLLSLFFFGNLSAQNQLENLKQENKVLQTENDYLKKTVELTTPLVQLTLENNDFKFLRFSGNQKEKTITGTFLVEAKDEQKLVQFIKMTLVDLEGNQYAFDHFKSSPTSADLSVDVPVQFNFTFKDVKGEPAFIKLFRFETRNEPKKNKLKFTRSTVEFKDLKVNWN